VDELNLDLSGIEDPVTARVTDVIRLSEALDKALDEAGQGFIRAALMFVVEDLKHLVAPRLVGQGDNIIPFPGGRDVH